MKKMPNKLLGKQAKNTHAVWSQDTKSLINVGNLIFLWDAHTKGYHFSPNEWSKI